MTQTTLARALAPRPHQTAFDAVREKMAQELHGRGVEFGPGCHPLPTGPFVEAVRYCDLHDRQAFLEKFPEVAPSIGLFPEHIDYRINFDQEPFVEMIGAGSHDFLIANHVLEHLVNPLGFLQQCHQLLRTDGVMYLALPDKRLIFDRLRRRTPLSDVVQRYREGTKVVAEERIVEFVNQVRSNSPQTPVEKRSVAAFGPHCADYQQVIAHHRVRSIHVNVWTLDDAVKVLEHLAREVGCPFELIDGISHEFEFILLLRKVDRVEVVDQYPLTLTRIFADSQHLLAEQQRSEDEARSEARFQALLQQLQSSSPQNPPAHDAGSGPLDARIGHPPAEPASAGRSLGSPPSGWRRFKTAMWQNFPRTMRAASRTRQLGRQAMAGKSAHRSGTNGDRRAA